MFEEMTELEMSVARAIWLAENMKGGSDDWADAARAAIRAVRKWDEAQARVVYERIRKTLTEKGSAGHA